MACCLKSSSSSLLATAIGTGGGLLVLTGMLAYFEKSPGEAERVRMMVTGAATTHSAERDAIGQTIAGIYEVISGPAGEARDWDRFREMFTQTGQLAVTLPGPDGRTMMSLSPDDYVERFGPSLIENGFRERETHRVLEVFGSVAHAFSTYRGTIETDPAFVVEGINSIQLVRVGPPDNATWKVHSILWHQKLPDEAIPEKYQPAPAGDL